MTTAWAGDVSPLLADLSPPPLRVEHSHPVSPGHCCRSRRQILNPQSLERETARERPSDQHGQGRVRPAAEWDPSGK